MAVSPLVAIIGRPNVGKSSLFNRLTGRRQAVVHAKAGTTRDANYGQVDWNGRSFTLVDTAGLSRADGEIEMQAQDQVLAVADIADLILVVVDAATMVTQEDLDATRLALKSGRPVVLVLGKADTANGTDTSHFAALGVKDIIGVSAIHGRGSGDLLDAITANVKPVAVKEADAPIKLALLGRPNVGKSSLLNALVGKQQVVVSDVPGTTRDVSRADLRYHGRTIQLLDTAGLRRRGKIEKGVEKYSALRTLAAIQEADVCLLLLDGTEPSVAGDHHMAGMVDEAGKGLIIVVNKWDAVEKNETTQARLAKKLQRDFQFAWWAPLIFASAETGLNITKLFELTTEIVERRRQQITTPKLNKLIERMVAAQPPAGAKGRLPKINYATQTGTEPPTFTLFCTYPALIHFSYRRYLENALRKEFDFAGTPIKLVFRHKHGDKAGPRYAKGATR
jgi:GTP-binding protein